jgi:hypothetical protein
MGSAILASFCKEAIIAKIGRNQSEIGQIYAIFEVSMLLKNYKGGRNSNPIGLLVTQHPFIRLLCPVNLRIPELLAPLGFGSLVREGYETRNRTAL